MAPETAQQYHFYIVLAVVVGVAMVIAGVKELAWHQFILWRQRRRFQRKKGAGGRFT